MANKAVIKMLSKYLDYNNVFLFGLIIKLFENISINKYIIELIKSKQLSYRPIYSLRLIELETLKTYIKIYLKTKFIWFSKFFVGISIFLN